MFLFKTSRKSQKLQAFTTRRVIAKDCIIARNSHSSSASPTKKRSASFLTKFLCKGTKLHSKIMFLSTKKFPQRCSTRSWEYCMTICHAPTTISWWSASTEPDKPQAVSLLKQQTSEKLRHQRWYGDFQFQKAKLSSQEIKSLKCNKLVKK